MLRIPSPKPLTPLRVAIQSLRFPAGCHDLFKCDSQESFRAWLGQGPDSSTGRFFSHVPLGQDSPERRILVLPTGLHLPIILATPAYRRAIDEQKHLASARSINVQRSFENIWDLLASKKTKREDRVIWESSGFSYQEFLAHHHEKVSRWIALATYQIACKHNCLVIAGADFMGLPWQKASPQIVPQIIANPPQWALVHQLTFRAQMLGTQSVLGFETAPGRMSWDTVGLVQAVTGTGFHHDDVVRLLDPEQKDHARVAPFYTKEGRGGAENESLEKQILAVCLAQTNDEILPHTWDEQIMGLPNPPDVLAMARLYGAPFSDETDLGFISVRGDKTNLAHRDVQNNFAWWAKTIR